MQPKVKIKIVKVYIEIQNIDNSEAHLEMHLNDGWKILCATSAGSMGMAIAYTLQKNVIDREHSKG